MQKVFTAIAGGIAGFAGRPLAFILALAVVLVWAVTGPIFGFSEVWQLVINTGTTIVTFLMVFLVQNTQNRDSAAMQAKLDELIRAIEGAREQFIGIEHMTDRENRKDPVGTRRGLRGGRAQPLAQGRRTAARPPLTGVDCDERRPSPWGRGQRYITRWPPGVASGTPLGAPVPPGSRASCLRERLPD